MKPSSYFRKTIGHSFSLQGKGLHRNEFSKLNFHPAETGVGILFKKIKGNAVSEIPAHLDHISDTFLSVTLCKEGESIQTIEHLMFAVSAAGITDLIIEIEGGCEIPILDGSALPFIEAFDSSHLVSHKEKIESICISQEISASQGERYIRVKPADSLQIDCMIDFPHPLLKNNRMEIEPDTNFLKKQIAPARTFGFLEEVDELQKKGYALGGSTDNAVVFTKDSTLNPLRFSEEPLYHKILDILGDLSLLGRPLQARIEAKCSGHALDIQLARKIIEHIQHVRGS